MSNLRLFSRASRLFSSQRSSDLSIIRYPIIMKNSATGFLVKCQLLSNNFTSKEAVIKNIFREISRHPECAVVKTIPTVHNPQAIMSLFCGHNSVSIIDSSGTIVSTMSKRPQQEAPLYKGKAFKDARFPELAGSEVTVYKPAFTNAEYDIDRWVTRAQAVPACTLYLSFLPGINADIFKSRVDEIKDNAYPYQLFNIESPFDPETAILASNCNSGVFEVMVRASGCYHNHDDISGAYCQEAVYRTILAMDIVDESSYTMAVEASGLLVGAKSFSLPKETYYASFAC